MRISGDLSVLISPHSDHRNQDHIITNSIVQGVLDTLIVIHLINKFLPLWTAKTDNYVHKGPLLLNGFDY
jgi:hypothetical protein